MFSSSKKPYTAISVSIDRMTDDRLSEDDLSDIINLVEVIRLQESGPTEAARAIRKKLKYGGPQQQIRALNILDGLIENAGSRFQTTFADEPLLERLRLMVRDDMVDVKVRQRCSVLFRQWSVAYRNTAGLTQIAALSSQLPKTKPTASQRYQQSYRDVVDETPVSSPGHSRQTSDTRQRGASSSATNTPRNTSTPLSSSKRDKTTETRAKFNLEKEKPQMTQVIAQASIASTNLLNALQLVNRETQRVSASSAIMERFQLCRALRRQLLRYIQNVESDEWLGTLINANDDLVKAMVAFDIMDKSIDDDSDSDAERLSDAQRSSPEGRMANLTLGNLVPPRPPRPGASSKYGNRGHPNDDHDHEDDEDDHDNPFGDSNAVKTPGTERPGMSWKTV